MAKVATQKMRKIQKMRKMKKTQKMKGGGMFSSLTNAASEYGKQGLSKASELGSSAYAQGSAAASEYGNKALSKASELGSAAYEKGSAAASSAAEKIKAEAMEKFKEALEKGKGILINFLKKMELDDTEIEEIIAKAEKGDMDKLKETSGVKKLQNLIENNFNDFIGKAKAAKAEEAESEKENQENMGGGMIDKAADDAFMLLIMIIMHGVIDGPGEWYNYMKTVNSNRTIVRGGERRKKNKPVKSRKNRKSKKSKSAKKH